MNIQQQEDYDYQMGCASELQNALSQSIAEFDSGWGLVQAAIDAGLFVVASVSTAYCRRTDACMGARYGIQSTHPTYEEASKERTRLNSMEVSEGDEWGYEVFPRPPMVLPLVSLTDDEVPF